MFSKLAATLFLASTLIAGALAKPVPSNHELPPVNVTPLPVHDVNVDVPVHQPADIVAPVHKGFSFNNWGGFSSLNNFDDFYGLNNFDGSHNFKQIIVKDRLVCRAQQVVVVQQRLLVLQELAKKIILEQVCEVEAQAIVFQQFYGGLGGFNHDLLRVSGHQVGFDQNIVKHFGNIINTDGTLTTHDFGFKGHELGSQTVLVDGHNWVDATSPATVFSAFGASQAAFQSLH